MMMGKMAPIDHIRVWLSKVGEQQDVCHRCERTGAPIRPENSYFYCSLTCQEEDADAQADSI